MHSVSVRPLAPRDAAAVARLSGELGYPASEQEIAARAAKLLANGAGGLFVAESGEGDVEGWIQVAEDAALTHEPQAVILGLVVSRARRRTGIGRELLREAERWAASRGYWRIRLRSRVAREEAHRFYLACGYAIEKTQHAFTKALA